MVLKLLSIVVAVLAFACAGSEPTGGSPTGALPYLASVQPGDVTRGGRIDLQGAGFSVVPQENTITGDGWSAVGASYSVSDDGSETLGFDMPENAPTGSTSVTVTVEGDSSNSLSVTVNP